MYITHIQTQFQNTVCYKVSNIQRGESSKKNNVSQNDEIMIQDSGNMATFYFVFVTASIKSYKFLTIIHCK